MIRTLVLAAAVTALSASAFAQPPAAPAQPAAAAAPAAAAPVAAAAGALTDEARIAAFNENDKNKDSKLTKEEYAGVLKTLGQDEALLEQLWPIRDANMDGFITREEFAPAIAQ